MKSILSWLVLIVSIAVIVSSCAESKEDKETTANTTDTTAPTVISVFSTADNQSSIAITDNITVTFSEAMDNTSITTNTDNSSCYGTLRLSSDNFSTCVRMSAEPVSSNSNKTFTLDPYDNLTAGTTYKTRITTGVKDTAGNALSSQYNNAIVGFFTTVTASSSSSSSSGNCGSGCFMAMAQYDPFTGVGMINQYVTSMDNGSSWDNSSPVVMSLNFRHTFGNNVLVGVGQSGKIVRSTDNGSSWDNVTSPTANDLRDVEFGNNTFVAGGMDGNIIRSTNNGASWDNVTSGFPTGIVGPPSRELRDIIFLE